MKELTEAQKKSLIDYEKEWQERIERLRKKWEAIEISKKTKKPKQKN